MGPDGVRVTLRVEPAIDRLRRWFNLVNTPDPFTPRAVARIEYQSVPGLIQRYLLRDQWVVDVESDSGERLRVPVAGRESAIERASQLHAGVQKEGVAFLRTLDG